MVAKMISGKDIRGALNYNENKVSEGKAACILASRFARKVGELTFYDKLERFQSLIATNEKVKTNTLHISLNFDVTEKLSPEKLGQIATTYMDRIGFGQQPYLVYEHKDAAHPHIHIVTTNIQKDGERIDLHNIGRNKSEPARKAIELEFGLVQAESKSKEQKAFINPIEVKKAIYGKSETKRSISNVVRMVARSYKYTSLPEFNAALRQFNVIADRGREGSKMFDKGGLLYSLTDERGKRIGVPIKASSIYEKPILKFLEKQYPLNEALRSPHKAKLRDSIDRVLQSSKSLTRNAFTEKLQREGVYVLFRENEEGRIYGITFVDNRSKTIFNGSDLGKSYSAKPILERLSKKPDQPEETGHFRPGFSEVKEYSEKSETSKADFGIDKIFEDLTASKTEGNLSPEAAMKLRKRRRRGRSL